MITNADKLVAVLVKWGQPFITYMANNNIQGLGFIQAIQNKVRSTGWVSPNWSIVTELKPMIEGVTGVVVGPMMKRYLVGVDDAAIPAMAHGIVDEAIKVGKLSLLDGKIEIEMEDLQELKKYLNYNLPVNESDVYHVITNENERDNNAATANE